jgi:hypothetical protein
MFTIQTMVIYLCILKLYHARSCTHARLCMLFLSTTPLITPGKYYVQTHDPSNLIRGVVLLVTSVSLYRSQPTQPPHPLTRGRIRNRRDGQPPKLMGYCGTTNSGTSSFGGCCGYLQNLDYRGARIRKINYHGI